MMYSGAAGVHETRRARAVDHASCALAGLDRAKASIQHKPRSYPVRNRPRLVARHLNVCLPVEVCLKLDALGHQRVLKAANVELDVVVSV